MSAPFVTLSPAPVVLSACVVAFASPVAAGPVPDTVQMAVMRQAIVDVPLVRVRGDFGTRSGHRPRLDSSGILFTEPLGGPHDAMLTGTSNPGPAEPIPWHQVTSMETDRASAGKYTIVGGLLGLAVGYAVALATTNTLSLENQQHHALTILGVSTAGGLGLGFLLGSLGEHRTIYPPLASGALVQSNP